MKKNIISIEKSLSKEKIGQSHQSKPEHSYFIYNLRELEGLGVGVTDTFTYEESDFRISKARIDA
jgi:hypothetical protein